MCRLSSSSNKFFPLDLQLFKCDLELEGVINSAEFNAMCSLSLSRHHYTELPSPRHWSELMTKRERVDVLKAYILISVTVYPIFYRQIKAKLCRKLLTMAHISMSKLPFIVFKQSKCVVSRLRWNSSRCVRAVCALELCFAVVISI